MTVTLEAPDAPPVDLGDALVHWTCECDADTAFCGESVADATWVPDWTPVSDGARCAACVGHEGTACPGCGVTR